MNEVDGVFYEMCSIRYFTWLEYFKMHCIPSTNFDVPLVLREVLLEKYFIEEVFHDKKNGIY